VEGALRNALGGEKGKSDDSKSTSPTLIEQLNQAVQPNSKVKVVLKATDEHRSTQI
jgi:hypothetical protein